MNSTNNAVIRADINTFVEEVAAVDRLFIGAQVCPLWEVDTKDGQYPRFKVAEAELLNAESTVRAPGGAYGRVMRDYDLDTYGTVDRGLEELVDDSAKADMSRFFDMEVQAAKLVQRSMMLAHELRVSQLYMNASNFDATAAIAAYTAANVTNGTLDFPGDVLEAIQRLTDRGYVPNAIVMSSNILTRVRRTSKLQNFIRGNRPSDSELLITSKMIGDAFEIPNVFIGKIPYNTAKKGKPASLSPVWGNAYIWVGQIEAGDPQNGGAGRTLVWNKEGGLWVSETYRDESRRSNVVRVRHHTSEKVIDANSATLITTSYA